jgi:hypothetical protein
MTTIIFEQPKTLEQLVTRVASVKLKIAEVRRRKAKNYQRPDVPVFAGVAIVHLNSLEALIANMDFNVDFGAELEPVPGSDGRFRSTDPDLEPKEAELQGMVSVCGVFETAILLEELISRINELFNKADIQLECEQRSAAHHASEELRMDARG